MKKLIAIILLVFSYSVYGQISPSSEQLAAWENFKASFGNAWQIQWDNFGTPKSIRGGETTPQGGEPRLIATSFLNALKDVFGFSNLEQNLLYTGTRVSGLDTLPLYHTHFQPHLNGIPIFDSRISVHINKKGEIFLVNAMAYRFSAPFDRTQPLLTSDAAIVLAKLNVDQPVNLRGEPTAKLGYLYNNDAYVLAWRIILPTTSPTHQWLVDISQDGLVMNKLDVICHVNGLANVYLTHPLDGSPVQKTIFNLDGTQLLRGTYADVYNFETNPNRATSATHDFRYPDTDVRFDEANAYYHVDLFSQRIKNFMPTYSLHQMKVTVREGQDPNDAVYVAPSDPLTMPPELVFGRGGAIANDLAREDKVFYHEYTHYVEDLLLGFPFTVGFYDFGEPDAVSEGLSDYFACSATNEPVIGEYVFQNGIIPIRYLNKPYLYPDSATGQSHHDGQIIGSFLWDMRNLMNSMNEGPQPDKLTLEAIDLCEPVTLFSDFWQLLVDADVQISYGDNLRDIHFGFVPRWNEALVPEPTTTNPAIDSGPYFSPEEPGTVYEGTYYLLCVDAIRNGQPNGTGGNWLLDYYWKSKYVPITMPYSIDQCVDYRPPVLNQTRVDSIWCWVYDGLGGVDSALRVVTIYPQPPPPPPAPTCPLLYVWNGSDFIEDNSILSYSGHSVKEQVITDYYHVQKPLAVKDNQYQIQIREVPGEKSFIDQIELLTVDHPLGRKVVTTTDGKILYTSEEFSPISALDDKGEEHAEDVGIKDGILYSSDRPGYLVLTFKLSEKTGRDQLVFGDPAKPCRPSGPEGGGRISPNLPLDSSFNAIKTEIQDLEGNWTELAQVPPRDHYTQNFRLIDQNQVRLGEIFKIRISWKSQYSVDEIKFYSVSEEPPQVNTLLPSRVDHSKLGSVGKLVSFEDGEFSTLVKGEKLDLFFPAEGLPLAEGFTRDFVVKASGYYIPYFSEPSASIPDRFELKDNYPNPFNAQTEIQYALPEPSEVNLSVYNIMGQKVRALAEGRQSAGIHKVSWDGRNEKGEIVASGVYFYSIKAGTYIETKKMTLLK